MKLEQDRPILVSVCSPVHNEAENLPEFIARIHQVMTPLFGQAFEQILVDDGSDDDSAEVIAELQKRWSGIRLLAHATNQGERAAWRSAFEAARGEIVVVMASDLQARPEDIPKLLAAVMNQGFDCATAFRARRKDSLYFRAVTRLFGLAVNLIFGLPVRDATSSFMAVRAKFLQPNNLMANDHRYILPILKRRGAKIKEVETTHGLRANGRTHYNRWKVVKALPEFLRFCLRLYSGYYDQKPRADFTAKALPAPQQAQFEPVIGQKLRGAPWIAP